MPPSNSVAYKKQSIVSPERIELNRIFTFSVNPDDNFQYFEKNVAQERLKKAEQHMESIIKAFINVDTVLYIDVSRTGRIHWHGTIMFKTLNQVRDFYLDHLNQLLQHHTVEIDTISNPETNEDYSVTYDEDEYLEQKANWELYCSKSEKLWSNKVSSIELRKNALKQIHKMNGKTKKLFKDFDQFGLKDLKEYNDDNNIEDV